MNEGLKVLLTRRSVRSYSDRPVRREDIDRILEAGKYAPTGMGTQDTCFAVVTERGLRDRLSAMNAAVLGGGGDPFYGAPAAIVVFADRTRRTHVEDGALALGNLLNAAHALDIDSCWINRAREMFESGEGRALARGWGVPDSYIGIGICILGYRDGEYPLPKPRKDSFVIETE